MKPLVFLHGWGQSKQIWHEQYQSFADASYLNLPRHGGAADSQAWLETLIAQLPGQPCILVGWSLGGQLAMQLAAQYPNRIHALVLVDTTPCFRIQKDWQHGCADTIFRGFEQGIQDHATKTMSRFFALMLHGDAIERAELNRIAKASINRLTPTSTQALQQGLELLANLDLRPILEHIAQPTWVVHGQCDAIIPYAAGAYLAEHIPHATLHRFESCGHAPFLTQTQPFNQLLESWCQTI